MKIYFTASVHGKKDYLENYKKIISYLEKSGYKIVSDVVLNSSLNDILKESDEEKIDFYKQVLGWINKSDMVIAEISHSSTDVGHEISLAIEKGKPVIALYTGKNEPHLLKGIISEKILIINYEIDNLKNTLNDALEEVKNLMDVRFNFFVPPQIVSYLDWITKHRRLPRAVFLRKLIEDHMARNKEYKA